MEMAMDETLSVKTVRRNCIECSGESPKAALWCPCDGVHSTACPYWLFRLGMKPPTVRAGYGDRLITPEKMPPAGVGLELLPDGFEKASTMEINIDGYVQPRVEVAKKPGRQLTLEEKEALAERLRKGRTRKSA